MKSNFVIFAWREKKNQEDSGRKYQEQIEKERTETSEEGGKIKRERGQENRDG